ncbi:MAG: phosphoribosyltransferase family protein, partial [Nitrososphaeraceae archaeon]
MQPAIFQNRIDAGEKLAERLLRLEQSHLRERDTQNIVIVGIPRGGVIIADIIASKLGAKLDIVVSRKIGAPDNSELAIGAVMPNGSYFLNQEIVDRR